MLRLCTNVDPGHGGRLGMGSLLGCTGRPWEYTGPVSLLKSALQKDIRRKRGEEAVRCVQHHPVLLATSVSGSVSAVVRDFQVGRPCQRLLQAQPGSGGH